MTRLSPALMLAIAIGITGCNRNPAEKSSGKPKVIATFSVLEDFVREVAGDKVELVTLVGPDGDAHEFQPTPQDVAAIGDASIVFEIGAGFESHWFDKAFQASGSKAERVVVSRGMMLDMHEGEADPHIWHQVGNAVHMVEKVRDGLIEIDPANASHYRSNAKRYVAKLGVLDDWIVQQVKPLPQERRKLVTSHDTFGYFAKRYGFTVAGSVLPSFSTEAADPSAADFAALVEKIKKEGVPAIFCETSHNAKLVNRLAEAAGVKVAPPLYTDALGPAGNPGATYDGMMRHNVTTIVEALRR